MKRTDDDRFSRASFAGDGGEAARELPLEILDEREILDAQQSENGGHRRKLRVAS